MKPIKLLFVLLLILPALPQVHAQTADKVFAGISRERLQRYDDFIKSEIEKKNLAGAVTLIVRNGTVVNKAAYGYSNVETKAPMKTDDLFYIQSMTKPIITVAFMMLYEEGYFSLNDPVSKYLPAFKDLRVATNVNDGAAGKTEPMNKEITIEQLLSHTAGFTHGLGGTPLDNDFIKEYFKDYPDVRSREAVLMKFPLVGQPGAQWYYSAAPDVLSVLIEQFSGKSTNDFLQERIFTPLGMKDTGYNLSKAQQSRVAKVYSTNAGVLTPVERQPKMEGNTVWSGVNGLFSTASDYLIFCQMLLNGGKLNGKEFLSRKTVDLMTSNTTGKLFTAPGEGFGLGFAVVVDATETRNLGSNGLFYWAGAFNTHFFIDPKEKLIAIFMTQEAHFNPMYHARMRQMVYQAFAD